MGYLTTSEGLAVSKERTAPVGCRGPSINSDTSSGLCERIALLSLRLLACALSELLAINMRHCWSVRVCRPSFSV